MTKYLIYEITIVTNYTYIMKSTVVVEEYHIFSDNGLWSQSDKNIGRVDW